MNLRDRPPHPPPREIVDKRPGSGKDEMSRKARHMAQLLAHVNKNGPKKPHMATRCWVWTGGESTDHYGRIRIDGTLENANVVAYELIIGKIPEGQQVCHHCDNPECVHADADPKVSHLFLDTQQGNMDDRAMKNRLEREGHR